MSTVTPLNHEQYKQRIIQHLRSGNASPEAWQEVAEHLAAESECTPLKLDVEMGLAAECKCDYIHWLGEACDHCNQVAEFSL